jgi:hypothetical protein
MPRPFRARSAKSAHRHFETGGGYLCGGGRANRNCAIPETVFKLEHATRTRQDWRLRAIACLILGRYAEFCACGSDCLAGILVTWQGDRSPGRKEKVVAVIVKAGAVAGGLHGHSAPAAAASAHGGALGIVTLITWVFTAGIGAYMLGSLIARGGLRQQRVSREVLPPAVLFGHFGLAITGLVVWVSYLATGWAVLAWSAVGLLMPAIGFGVSTVTLWTPYPGPPVAARASPPSGPGGAGPAGGMLAAPAEDLLASQLTDDVLASALTDAARAGKLIDDLLARLLADPPRAVRKPLVR